MTCPSIGKVIKSDLGDVVNFALFVTQPDPEYPDVERSTDRMMSVSTKEEAGTVALVDRIIARGVSERASDIHLEPRNEAVRVRFRIDGILVERPAFPIGFRQSVVSRLKVMARLDIAEKRLPQDGTFRVRVDETDVDVRMSSFPTEYGEKVVLRLLIQVDSRPGIDGLGMSPHSATQLRRFTQHAHGIFLVTGPTGSGKTSTLYAMLQETDGRSRNIVTLEDPIEYRFDDVVQAQVNPRIGFDFARGLRAMLRQDPDVIMVGEMRDAETADIAFKAALTGHLVLSTLHTSSAIETFVRLFDMGLERYVVASALNGMLAQRLVRTLCESCKREAVIDASTRDIFEALSIDDVKLYEPVGCGSCHGTGYDGRAGVFELIEADDPLKDLVKSESTTRLELADYLASRGHGGLRRAALCSVASGVTSMEEALRVT